MKFSIGQYVCPKFVLRNKTKVKLLELSKKVIKEKISIEKMIERSLKLDQISSIILNENQLKLLNEKSRVRFNSNGVVPKIFKSNSLNMLDNNELIAEN